MSRLQTMCDHAERKGFATFNTPGRVLEILKTVDGLVFYVNKHVVNPRTFEVLLDLASGHTQAHFLWREFRYSLGWMSIGGAIQRAQDRKGDSPDSYMRDA